MSFTTSNNPDDNQTGSAVGAAVGFGVASTIMSVLISLTGLVSLILVIVFGVKMAKLAQEGKLSAAPGKHAFNLGIASAALMGVPIVNIGLSAAMADAVKKLSAAS